MREQRRLPHFCRAYSYCHCHSAAPPTHSMVCILLQMPKPTKHSCSILQAQKSIRGLVWWGHTTSPWQDWEASSHLLLETVYAQQAPLQASCWNLDPHSLRALLRKPQPKPSHAAPQIITYSHLSLLPSTLLPSPSLAWQTSASFHPPSSGVRPGIRSSLLHKSLGDY